ncbi:RNA polymerase III-inhibiting protein maf1 [Mortierella sp. GBA35]|nr:RNA polymerase III-inhibiting protein maf1 [Mortierella sp. AD031]KAF9102696.1 RNA polymerase III-inhibiting protein maf1 [Mortierella sp. GBA35]KAG0215837.1 RNA polymerase III-inhibiting protein maf1 [Mortierella sp. NVP41]
MKFLEYPGMEAINSALNFETPECKVYGRVEPYSCKAAGADKKLFKQLENKYDPTTAASNNNILSPPDDDSIRNIISPFGPMDQPASRKTLFYLIGTLNASFPDYDFSDTKPEHFRKEPSVGIVVNSINATLFNHGNERAVKELRIWESIDQLIDLEDSDVYSFNPDTDSDPNDEEGGGTLWSFNYFFYNRKLKRIIYFTMRGVSSGVPVEEDGEEDDGNFSNTDDDQDGVGHRRKRSNMDDDFVAGDMDLF